MFDDPSQFGRRSNVFLDSIGELVEYQVSFISALLNWEDARICQGLA